MTRGWDEECLLHLHNIHNNKQTNMMPCKKMKPYKKKEKKKKKKKRQPQVID